MAEEEKTAKTEVTEPKEEMPLPVNADNDFIPIEDLPTEKIELPSDLKIESGTLKQLNAYRKSRFKDIQYGFFNDGTLTLFGGRNPIVFEDIEVGE